MACVQAVALRGAPTTSVATSLYLNLPPLHLVADATHHLLLHVVADEFAWAESH